MTMESPAMKALEAAIWGAEPIERAGHVVAVRGQLVEASGPVASIGERCRIEMPAAGREVEAEVIGFARGITILMPLVNPDGIALGQRVTALGRRAEVPVGPELLGRVVDAFGSPIDGRGPLRTGQHRGLRANPLQPMLRRRVDKPLATGVRVVDSLFTLAKGQRVGLFAGSGVGKSTLMGMMAQGTGAAVRVIALIGERSREVREFVEDQLDEEGLARSVVVVATADEPAIVRSTAAYAATAIAEYFRDRGDDVLLMMDSLTRFAMARREIGLCVGEPPTARGYTPSVFSELPQLCERAGPGTAAGSITGVYTVLVDGDDMNEPVADTLRATLDGHIVLSRDIAASGLYPAVDILGSISRLYSALASEHDEAAARRLLACCALFERNRQLIEIGAYKPGVNRELDGAVRAMPRIRAFLAQSVGERAAADESRASLRLLAQTLEAAT
jgi:flagellum-specific ATP synthase